MKKIRISAVSYLNTKPFIYGLEAHAGLLEQSAIELDMPAECARKLLANEADIGLVPVAVIPELQEAHIITGYCIGAVGAVNSVMLYSDVPLTEIKKVYLDYQSRTSVALARVLARERWKIDPEWVPASPGFEMNISGSEAGVIIGDRTFHLEGKFKYVFDLSEEWLRHTGLPFVFACWVANKELPAAFVSALDSALGWGIDRRLEVASELAGQYPGVDVKDYLGNRISYNLDAAKREGLALFLRKLGSLE
jgi:chorismate dehydratase